MYKKRFIFSIGIDLFNLFLLGLSFKYQHLNRIIPYRTLANGNFSCTITKLKTGRTKTHSLVVGEQLNTFGLINTIITDNLESSL